MRLRATRDVDVSVLAPYGEETQVLDVLLEKFTPRRSDARAFAIDHRVLLLKSGSGPDIDVALAAFPFELEALEQSTIWEAAPGVRLRTCPAEHLIAYKLVAARPHDLVGSKKILIFFAPSKNCFASFASTASVAARVQLF